jgi:hypothetical protein
MWKCNVIPDSASKDFYKSGPSSIKTAGLLNRLGLKSSNAKAPTGWTYETDIQILCYQAAPHMKEALKNTEMKSPDNVIQAVLDNLATENLVFQKICQSHGFTGKGLDKAVASLNAALLKRAKDNLQKDFDGEMKEIDEAAKAFASGKKSVVR